MLCGSLDRRGVWGWMDTCMRVADLLYCAPEIIIMLLMGHGAAATKSHQSCPTLCDPTDGSPPGSHPWDSPGKNTGVGCHFLLQCMKAKSESEVAQSCLTLSDPMDCSPPGSSIHGIFQARVLEWVSLLCSKVSLKYNSDRESFWHRH